MISRERGLAWAAVLVSALVLAGCKRKKQDDTDSAPAAVTAPPPAATPVAAPPETAAAAPAPAPAPVGGPLRRAGDSVQVRWKGKCYAAKIVNVAKPGVYFITYVGYSHSWDETIGENRICK